MPVQFERNTRDTRLLRALAIMGGYSPRFRAVRWLQEAHARKVMAEMGWTTLEQAQEVLGVPTK